MAPERRSRSRDGGAAEAGRTTLKDVARLAGVSPMTVSNVVNDTGRGYNDETREKVLRAVQRANYRPDIAARSLRTNRHQAVGMLVVQGGPRFLADPYITNLLDGLCLGLNQAGYSLVLQGLQPEQLASATLVRQRQTDGLCVLMSGDFDLSPTMKVVVERARQPVVLFQQAHEYPGQDICVLRQDDFEGGRALCEHVLERGARALVAIVPQLDWPAMAARLAGIRHEVETRGRKADLTVVTSKDETPLATQTALDTFLREGGTLDAVLAANDQMAIAAYRLLQRRGISVPGDALLTGFNGFDFLDYFAARLTTVRSPAHELGELGAHHMVRRIESGRFESSSVVLPVTLVNGDTT
ncbi:MAG: LacI family DNA-binding transcriptional regulator [Devosia sp.]|nr:LacI family DNA-binding transcriptional regulator [Devosia sp.]